MGRRDEKGSENGRVACKEGLVGSASGGGLGTSEREGCEGRGHSSIGIAEKRAPSSPSCQGGRYCGVPEWSGLLHPLPSPCPCRVPRCSDRLSLQSCCKAYEYMGFIMERERSYKDAASTTSWPGSTAVTPAPPSVQSSGRHACVEEGPGPGPALPTPHHRACDLFVVGNQRGSRVIRVPPIVFILPTPGQASGSLSTT